MVEKPRRPAGDPTGGQVAHHRGTEPDVTLDPALVDVLESAARPQQLVPDAVLVGGSAAAAYAGHRLSFDHHHVVDDLRGRFDVVLEALEAEGEWVTNQVRPGKVILGQIGDIEAGVRQLIRRTPLEVTELTLPSGAKVRVPTPDETLRIKAFLIVKRNQVRDYLDVAALADRYGIDHAAAALARIDDYYADQHDGQGEGGASQAVRELAAPTTAHPATPTALHRDEGLAPRWHQWSDVVSVCRRRRGELAHHLGGNPLALAVVLVGVVVVDAGERGRGMVDAVPVGQRGDVEVVADLVALDDQERLDPQRLVRSRNPHLRPGRQGQLGDLQRGAPDELANTGLDVPDLTKDHLAGPYPVGDPLPLGLQSLQDDVEPSTQVVDDMVVVEGQPVPHMCRRGAVTDQNRVGDQLLQPGGGLQDIHEGRVQRHVRLGASMVGDLPAGGVANGLAWLLDHGAMLSDLIRTVERPSTAGATDADHQRAARPRIAVRSTSDGIDRRYLLGMVTLPDTQTGAHSGLCAASSASGVVRRRRRAGVPGCAPCQSGRGGARTDEETPKGAGGLRSRRALRARRKSG